LTSDGGQESMCGWLKDRFGLSWQVVPAEIGSLLTGEKANQVMQAIMQMKKLDLSTLRQAAGQE
jgi:predicted 3-demethylubiquinone-9 3-methyltransferase (glyoxalase superfamily)